MWRARPFFAGQYVGAKSNARYLAFEQVGRLERLPLVDADADLRRRLLTMLDHGATDDLFRSLVEAQPDARPIPTAVQPRWRGSESGRQIQDLWMLHDAALRIGESTARAEIAQILLEATLDLSGTDLAWLTTFTGDVWLLEVNQRVDPPTSKRSRILGQLPICRAAARTRQPLQTSDLGNDHRWLQDNSVAELVSGEELSSAVAIPAGSPRQGHLWVLAAASRSFIRLDPWLGAILNALVTHAARAIVTVDSLQTYRAELQAASKQNGEMEAKQRILAQVSDIETELLRSAAAGTPVAELAGTLVTGLDAHVVVTDGDLNVIVNLTHPVAQDSAADREARVQALAEVEPGEVTYSQRLGAWLTASPHSSEAPVRIAIRPIAPRAMSDVFPSLLPQIASVLAIATLTERLYEKTHNSTAQELISCLLGNPSAPAEERKKQCATAGLNLDGPLGLVALHLSRRPDPETMNVALAAASPYASLLGYEEETIVALTQPDSLDDACVGLHRQLTKHCSTPVTAATCVSTGGDSSIAAAFTRTSKCIRLMKGLGLGGTIGNESAIQPYAALLEPSGAELAAQYVDDRIEPLVDYDRMKQAELARTLLVYLDSGRNTVEAAAALHIHANTLRQRLERIDALLPNWRAPEQTLPTHLALRLHALRQELVVD